MNVFISVDMEGVAGIVDWAQCLAGGDDYALGRELLVGEVNAAIAGCLSADSDGRSASSRADSDGRSASSRAARILVNDAHSVMRNLPPDALEGRASYLSGRFKPWYMMQGLDASYDACVFLGYHAAMASPGVLSHTYNPRAIADVRLNGTVTGEAGLNALVAQHFGVPVAVITGDQFVGPEAEPFCPGIAVAQVKDSISRYAASHLHPLAARELIQTTVRSSLSALPPPPSMSLPATVEVDFLSPDMAEQSSWVRGVSRVDSRTVTLTDDDPLRLFRTFITLVYLTRSLVEA